MGQDWVCGSGLGQVSGGYIKSLNRVWIGVVLFPRIFPADFFMGR